MERLERITVQLREAKRLAEPGDVPHSRLALLLLDNVAETLLHYEAMYLIGWDRYSEQLLSNLERGAAMAPLSEEMLKLQSELQGKVLSKTRKSSVRREFGAKVDFLLDRGVSGISDVTGRCLKKLHKYRNDTYHRDEARPATLNTAVEIYFYLCCKMLAEIPVHSMSISGPVPQGLVDALGTKLAGLGMDAHVTVAEWLLGGGDLESQEIQQALAAHVLDRLEALDEDLKRVASEIGALSGEDVSADDILIFVQLGPDFDGRTPWEKIRQLSVPIGRAEIEDWRSRGIALADLTPATAAFAVFADIEDEFEPLEDDLEELVISVDTEIQHRIDEALGK